MCAWIIPPLPGLIEPAIAPEFFINGYGAIERAGDCARFYLYANQGVIETTSAPQQKIVAVKIVRPLTGLADTISQLATCLSCDHLRDCFPDIVRGGGPRLVE